MSVTRSAKLVGTIYHGGRDNAVTVWGSVEDDGGKIDDFVVSEVELEGFQARDWDEITRRDPGLSIKIHEMIGKTMGSLQITPFPAFEYEDDMDEEW